LEAEVAFYPSQHRQAMVIAAMAPGGNYQVLWNGQPAPFFERYPGILEISVEPAEKAGRLQVLSW
jgi:hypothetical protein